jgi:SAM-dependent methyltransferase
VCHGKLLARVLSLGAQPLANAFLREKELVRPEPTFPLDVYFCRTCFFLQLCDVVSPEVLFRDYMYASSTSEAFAAHFRALAEDVAKRFELTPNSLVVDIGSNDGILLRPFKEKGIRVLGIEPAANIARMAQERGIETLVEFFGERVAEEVVKTRGLARVVTATNVFAHVDGLEGFVEGVKALMEDEGVFIIEVPYLGDLVVQNLFDTIYHEHLSYFSMNPLTVLFGRLGMEVFDVQHVPSHGGSLRVFIKKTGTGIPVTGAVGAFRARDEQLGLYAAETYEEFGRRVDENRRALVGLLRSVRSEGCRIAGYGAAAKGNVLLNYFGIGRDILEYIVDDSELKQGLFTPGTHIPIVSVERLKVAPPDYVLILAWNFAEPIMKKLESFRERGGRFVIPVPRPHVLA